MFKTHTPTYQVFVQSFYTTCPVTTNELFVIVNSLTGLSTWESWASSLRVEDIKHQWEHQSSQSSDTFKDIDPCVIPRTARLTGPVGPEPPRTQARKSKRPQHTKGAGGAGSSRRPGGVRDTRGAGGASRDLAGGARWETTSSWTDPSPSRLSAMF